MPVTEGESFEPDPSANLGAPSFGPDPSSIAPDQSTAQHQATEDESSGASGVTEEPLPEFDPRCRDDLEGLLFMGALTERFTWAGHRFHLRTMKMEEYLQVGLLTKRYADSAAEMRAYQSAVCAGCIISVDGKHLPALAMSDEEEALEAKFFYILRSWYPWTIDAVYQQYLILEHKVAQVIEAMGKAPGSEPLIPGLNQGFELPNDVDFSQGGDSPESRL